MQTNNRNIFKKYTGILFYIIYSKNGMNNKRLVEFLNKFLLTTKNKVIHLSKVGCYRSKIIKNLIGLKLIIF
jgi:hypothetical protein